MQIKQVLDNSEAISIYAFFYEVFHDLPPPILVSESRDNSRDDGDENWHEWPDLLEDDSLQQMLNSGRFGDSTEISGLFANSEDEIQQTNHMYPLELDSVLQNVEMQCKSMSNQCNNSNNVNGWSRGKELVFCPEISRKLFPEGPFKYIHCTSSFRHKFIHLLLHTIAQF